jgi:hypothetical protein
VFGLLLVGALSRSGRVLAFGDIALALILAAVPGVLSGAIIGLGVGAVSGGLLGLWTDTHPRPLAARQVYRQRATVVVGVLMGAVVALALGAALLGWSQPPVFVHRSAFDRAQTVLPAFFIAAQAAVAAGWSTCRLLGWYAARPE